MTESAQMQAVDRLMYPAVAETVEALTTAPEDAALVRLAESYARQLDKASGAAAAADRVLKALRDREEDDPDTTELISALKAKLAEQVAWTNLGPKLHAALTELGASPKARAGMGKSKPTSEGGKLASMRAGRAS